jgi:NADH dehydrogenase
MESQVRLPRAVIVGAGFAGLRAARALAKAPLEVLVLDRENHHLFQPLLYQVATAALSPADIATPVRKVLRRQPNARVLLAEVTGFDLTRRVVRAGAREIAYDWLIVAPGVTHSWFDHAEWAPLAPGLKTIEDATEIRRRFLLAFEEAEAESDPARRAAALTFAIVGAGPTGVELAGAMAEIARRVLPSDFRSCDTTDARVVLLEAGSRVLAAMSEASSRRAHAHLAELGVEARTGARVTEIDEQGLVAGGERILCRTVVWAAGVEASPLGRTLGSACDRAGRVLVEPDLSVPGHPEVFVAGDLAALADPVSSRPVPGIAPAALQMGAHAARAIAAEARARARGKPAPARAPFRYRDKGQLATVGRSKAVADLRRARLSGFLAWVLWGAVHVAFLIQFRNRLFVLLGWLWTWAFHEQGARLIVGKAPPAAPSEDRRAARP